MIRNIAQKKLIKKPGSTFRSNQAFWNSGYTHDRDYLAYKKAPKGRAGGRNRPWCLGWWKMVPRGENDGFQYVSTNVWIMSFNVFFLRLHGGHSGPSGPWGFPEGKSWFRESGLGFMTSCPGLLAGATKHSISIGTLSHGVYHTSKNTFLQNFLKSNQWHSAVTRLMGRTHFNQKCRAPTETFWIVYIEEPTAGWAQALQMGMDRSMDWARKSLVSHPWGAPQRARSMRTFLILIPACDRSMHREAAFLDMYKEDMYSWKSWTSEWTWARGLAKIRTAVSPNKIMGGFPFCCTTLREESWVNHVSLVSLGSTLPSSNVERCLPCSSVQNQQHAQCQALWKWGYHH